MLPSSFCPKNISKKNLIRIGPNRDGGYIVHKDILKNLDYIITCGLNDDWEFEKQLIKCNKNCKFFAYDHTVTNFFWLKYTYNNLLDFLFLKKLTIKKIIKIFLYIEYKFFFKNYKKHFIKKIGNKNSKNQITINSIFNTLPNKKKIILKIDIEGDEFKILGDIINNQKKIDHLIIEFHNVYNNLKKIKKFIIKIKSLKLIHIHGNNFDKVINGVPNVLEMTFVNKLNYKKNKSKKNLTYPIKNLDFPNHKSKKDINLYFNYE